MTITTKMRNVHSVIIEKDLFNVALLPSITQREQWSQYTGNKMKDAGTVATYWKIPFIKHLHQTGIQGNFNQYFSYQHQYILYCIKVLVLIFNKLTEYSV